MKMEIYLNLKTYQILFIWQTHLVKALRKNFAGIGMTYDPIRDAFISAKPFDSWVLDETTCRWEAPLPWPGSLESESLWYWDEALYQSDNTKGWIEDP